MMLQYDGSNEYQELLLEFKEYLLVEKGLSTNTIESYTMDLKKFFLYLKVNQMSVLSLNWQQGMEVLAYEQKRLSKKSLKRYATTLRQFYRFLWIKKYIQENPFENLELPKVPRTIPTYLTWEEVIRFFEVFDQKNPFELRDRAIFELMYACGLRVSEVVNLKLKDIDFWNSEICVMGKGGQQRIVPLGEKTHQTLKLYFDEARNRITKKTSEFVFLGKKGNRLDRRSVWRSITKYAKRAGLEKKISPHTLRHSFATHLIQNQADIRVVQELLGHKDITATQIYTHITKTSLRNLHKQFHPRG
ncbi:MAG: site-specific tyrosine recombinase XerD [Leptospiraceae bacterium]|nr:site-specific tyrosine recombinase XerD [Leptospiraceae bacterium]MDW7975300.1 site-specific tyrosine recombinase XerD [Leptospiraceae bacterium]